MTTERWIQWVRIAIVAAFTALSIYGFFAEGFSVGGVYWGWGLVIGVNVACWALTHFKRPYQVRVEVLIDELQVINSVVPVDRDGTMRFEIELKAESFKTRVRAPERRRWSVN